MYFNIYADPVQGITISVAGENGGQAVPTTYSEYLDELIALSTVYGNAVEGINVLGNEAYAAKIAQEIEREYPNTPTMYAWKEKEQR